MLTESTPPRVTLLRTALLCTALLAASCSSDNAAPPPSTVDLAAAAASTGLLTLKIGTIVNTAAPTAERDQRLAEVLGEAASFTTTGAAVDLEVITIDELDDVDSAVAALVEEGVTVIASLCDDGSVPLIVEAAVERGLLAVTTCVSLPTPPLESTSPQFFDLASMDDAGGAVAAWVGQLEATRVGTIRSDLIPDVDDTCSAVERGLAERDIALDVSLTFTELVDDPVVVVDGVVDLLENTDAVVLCALPPAAGDLVMTLRAQGYEQPIIVPWFVDPQVWAPTVNDVYVVSPSSRHGDDPDDRVVDLLGKVGDSAQASDVITADSVTMLSRAAARVGSVGSSRVAEGLRSGPVDALSGELRIDESRSDPSGRNYRVIEITNGRERFTELVTASS